MSYEAIEIAKDKMGKTLNILKQELAAIRAGRANPQVLDKITVDYYGAQTPINQVGNITVPEARLLVISPWDPNLIKEIEKAIQSSDIGINPSDDGKVIRLVFPELTEERRKDLGKKIKKIGEDTKVSVRSIRRDVNDKLKKDKKANLFTEDDLKNYENEVQKITDDKIKIIDAMIAEKEKEIMEV